MDRSVVADLDQLAAVLARQKPTWEPGTRQAYHALTLGFYEGELLRRVDPQHRSLGQFFQDEIASRLREDVYIRLPETIPNSRLATLAAPSLVEMLRGFGLRLPALHSAVLDRILWVLWQKEYPPCSKTSLRGGFKVGDTVKTHSYWPDSGDRRKGHAAVSEERSYDLHSQV